MQAKKELILVTQRVLGFPIKHVVTNESSARRFTLKVIYLFIACLLVIFPIDAVAPDHPVVDDAGMLQS